MADIWDVCILTVVNWDYFVCVSSSVQVCRWKLFYEIFALFVEQGPKRTAIQCNGGFLISYNNKNSKMRRRVRIQWYCIVRHIATDKRKLWHDSWTKCALYKRHSIYQSVLLCVSLFLLLPLCLPSVSSSFLHSDCFCSSAYVYLIAANSNSTNKSITNERA